MTVSPATDRAAGVEQPRTRRRRTGLRLRIAATIAVVVLVAVAALVVVVHLLVVANRVSEARRSADERIQAVVEIRRTTGLLSFDAVVDDPALPPPLRQAMVGSGSRATYVTGGSERELWAAAQDGEVLLSTRSTFTPVDASVQALDRALLGAGAVTVVAAVGVAWLSATRLSRRLRLAATTARHDPAALGPGALQAAVGSGRDEVSDLAVAVDLMAERLAGRLAAERRLTADVAHDLRTPVTGLLAAADLLEESRPAAMVRDRARALADVVEDLLEVARLDSGAETAVPEEVGLAELVAEVVRRGERTGTLAPGTVHLTAPRHGDAGAVGTVRTDPRRVRRIVTNLVGNAVQHGKPPVLVEVGPRQVVVTDHGPGFDAGLLRDGPQRFRRSPARRGGGHGLGLVIAAAQAEVLGGRLELGSGDTGGARVSLLLPSGPDSGPRTPSTGPNRIETGS